MAERTRIPALDGLRGVAALLIATYHAWLISGQAGLDGGPVRDALSSGHLAVQLFFVLSGFVLFWPIALARGEIGSIRVYARRRIARIVPAYYVALVVGVLLFPWLVTVSDDSIAAHALLLHNEARLVPGYEGALGFGVNPALWTLSVEWVFYLTLPLVAAAFWRRPWHGLAAAAAVAVGARLALGHADLGARTEELLLSSALLNAVNFAAGMAAACLLAARPRLIGPKPARLAVAAFAAAALALLVVAGDASGGAARDAARSSALLALAVPAVFAGLVAALALAPAGLLASRPARWLGDVSYGVFLGHFLVIEFAGGTIGIGHDGSTRAFVAMEAAVLAGALLYGWLSWTLVERPAQRFARRDRGTARRPAYGTSALTPSTAEHPAVR